MSNVSTFFGPTMPGTSTTPDLDTVMAEGNSTSYAYYGTGMGMGTTVVTGPTVYTANDGDYAIICDCSLGPVRIQLDPGLPNMYFIKAIGVSIGLSVEVFVLSGGTIDGVNPFRLSSEYESILVVKNGATDYNIVSSHLSIGTVNGELYTENPFTGSSIVINHNLNTQPSTAFITPANADTAAVLANGYYITISTPDQILITLLTPAVAVNISIYFGVTKN